MPPVAVRSGLGPHPSFPLQRVPGPFRSATKTKIFAAKRRVTTALPKRNRL